MTPLYHTIIYTLKNPHDAVISFQLKRRERKISDGAANFT